MSSPKKLLEHLTENYSVFYEPTLLEIGIHAQIKRAVGDAFTEKSIQKLLTSYTQSAKYNASVVKHLDWELRRSNLDGSDGTVVSVDSKRHHVVKFLAALKRKEQKEDVSHYVDLREQALRWLDEEILFEQC
ncbi:ProQ/FINO family protein [Marinobacterium sp. xm-m-312]|uniref:ProQ/FINO family protein n=1 Tax=Marinobacterium sp. xm-m-312 TaxID=2497741 RepID=UPI001568C6B6|nr:ProQ/FINO family protein [Marinobacterium sp. xm-m-312]NRQ22735.1 ProQ/FINO family protein [Marinobacterium sp. xm-m-312]